MTAMGLAVATLAFGVAAPSAAGAPPAIPAPDAPAPAAPAGDQTTAGTRPVAELTESPTGRYLVTFASDARTEALTRGMNALVPPARVQRRFRHVATGVVASLSFAEAQALATDPQVASVVADQLVQVDDTQTLPPPAPVGSTPPLWGLDRIDQESSALDNRYTYPNSGAGVTVYVVDTGVFPHSDFGGRVTTGYSAIDVFAGNTDCHSHGTHVAGTIGSATYGVAKSVTIVPIRALDCTGNGSALDLIDGVEWAIAHHVSGPAVLNASVGGGYFSPWDTAVNAAVADGITVVVAAGNETDDACFYSPASAAAAITVGSIDSDDNISGFSNFGSCVDLFAPGGAITSTSFTGSGTLVKSGTSMASPHVAGVAALLLAQFPTLSPSAVGTAITRSALENYVGGSLNGAPNLLLSVALADAMRSAWPISPWGASRSASNLFATKEPGEPAHASTGGGSTWFRFKTPIAGSLVLSTEGSTFDTLLGVYTGSSVSALTPVASNDDAFGSFSWSRVEFAVAPNTTYWVAIDGWNNQRGSAVLAPTFTPAGPPNDAFASASAIAATRAAIIDAHSRGATHQVGEPTHAGQAGSGSVWWKLTAPANGRLVVSTQGSTFDTTLGVYTGSAVGALTTIGNDDDTAGLRSQVAVNAVSGTEYQVAVDGYHTDPIAGTGGVQLNTAFVNASNGWYSPLPTGVRLMDTRPGLLGVLEGADVGTAFAANETRRYSVSAVAGLGGAVVAALNITTLQQSGSGNLKVYPCALATDPAPSTSAINFQAATVIANNALVGLNAGAFCVRASAATHVIIDAGGSFNNASNYTTLASPARLVDSRPGQLGLVEVVDETTPYGAGEIRRYVVPAAGGIPATGSLSAVAVNLTAIAPTANGNLKAWPCDSLATPAPDASTLNYRTGATIANAAVLGVATNGGICVQSSAGAHVIVDVTGWVKLYGSTVVNAQPQRMLDTRQGELGTMEFTAGRDNESALIGGTTYIVFPQMEAGVPGDGLANSVVLNITAAGPPANGNIAVWPCNTPASAPPAISALNYRPGGATANGAIVGLLDGSFCIRSTQTTHVIIDVTGWQAAAF
ncbi:MAG: S8 family serine peptidase [Actinomycetota bacterium]|nr:S8 family serine peptidase [Actinomycetota bacterium]